MRTSIRITFDKEFRECMVERTLDWRRDYLGKKSEPAGKVDFNAGSPKPGFFLFTLVISHLNGCTMELEALKNKMDWPSTWTAHEVDEGLTAQQEMVEKNFNFRFDWRRESWSTGRTVIMFYNIKQLGGIMKDQTEGRTKLSLHADRLYG